MNSETELKPCPFCGEAKLIAECNEIDDEAGENWHYIRCANCSVTSGYYNTREIAIDAWNRRAVDADALLEEVAERLEAYMLIAGRNSFERGENTAYRKAAAIVRSFKKGDWK